jgi:hypothetical protein
MIEGIIGCSSFSLDDEKQVPVVALRKREVAHTYLSIKRLYVYTPPTHVENNTSAAPLSL